MSTVYNRQSNGTYVQPPFWVRFDLLCSTPLSAIFQLYHGDQFYWWKKQEYPERTTDHGQATGKLYHLRLPVECTFFCNLQSWRRTHAVLVIGLYELLGNPSKPPGPHTFWGNFSFFFFRSIHALQNVCTCKSFYVLNNNSSTLT